MGGERSKGGKPWVRIHPDPYEGLGEGDSFRDYQGPKLPRHVLIAARSIIGVRINPDPRMAPPGPLRGPGLTLSLGSSPSGSPRLWPFTRQIGLRSL
jgi:hypothetical protein